MKNTKETKTNKKTTVKTKIYKATDILTWTVVVFIAMIIFSILLMLLIGFRPAVVLTGSMEPTITPGDMIIYKGISEENIKVGDILTFYMTQESMDNHSITYTHRVIAVKTNDLGQVVFQMQGDANESPDSILIPEERILGKVNFIVPWIGQLFLFVKNNFLLVSGMIFAIILVGYFAIKFFKSLKKTKQIDI